MRALRITVLAAAALVLAPGTAHAGGSVWEFDRAQYQPGDVATGQAAIAWDHDADLGRPDEGPYHAWLLPPGVPQGPYPSIPDGALRVAEIEVRDGPVELEPGFLVGPHHARFRFPVPDLPPGIYAVLHCNDPCTSTLADITWGQVVIRSAQTPDRIDRLRSVDGSGPVRRVPACVLEGLTRSRRWFPVVNA